MYSLKSGEKMMQKQELIKKVKYYFGLNVYESKVWLALLSKNGASVGEIAEISGVPRSRVYDVLKSLEKQGFVIAKLGKPIKYIAVKPAVVVEKLKTNVMKEAKERIEELNNVQNISEFKELEQLYSKGIEPVDLKELSSAIRGNANIYNHLKELITGAKKEVILVSTIAELKRRAHFLKPLFEKLKKDNIKILVACNAEENNTLFAISKALGVPVKKIRVNSRFCIVDAEKALITITPETEEDLAILLHSPFFSRAMISFIVPTLH
ncbi:MAG: helix-turn-helix domain-containing protein [Candidatus Pacearchaeota archaeon]